MRKTLSILILLSMASIFALGIAAPGPPAILIVKDPWFDIRAFGAIGDGVTDDSAAIQAAYDALGANGGIVFLPPGTYNTGTTTINGKALSETIFAAGASISYTGTGIALDFHDATRGNMKQVTIRRPRITATNGTCLRLSGFHQCVIIEPYLAGKIGIKLLNGNTARIIGGGEIKKDGTDREVGSIGIDISDTTSAINDIIIDITHIWEYEKGIQIGPPDYSQATHGIAITAAFEYNKDAIYINTGTRHTIENCWFEAQTRAAIYINNDGSANPPSRLVLLSNTFGEADSVYNIYSVNYAEIHIVTPVVGAGIFSYGNNTKVNLIGASIGISALADDATPSVLNGKLFKTGGTTTITDFDDGMEGQELLLLAEHTITITDGTNILLRGSQNFDMVSGDALVLVCKANKKWYELSRTIDAAQTYNATNVVTDRDYDADSTSTAELADVLGTLIADLRARGIVK